MQTPMFAPIMPLLRTLATVVLLRLIFSVEGPCAASESPLELGFRSPPAATKPWCYWYWISDNISREGITRDLEAMARVGIGEAFVGNIFLEDVPAGKTKVLSEAWWGLVEHAIREGGRVGVDLGLFNCPGWSQSGGPWVKPEQTMRYLVSSETRVRGPVRFEQKLPVPKEPFQEVALSAFPAPAGDADSLAAHSPRLSCLPAAPGLAAVVDRDVATAFAFPAGAGQGSAPFAIDVDLEVALTARSLSLVPGETAWAAEVELEAADAAGPFRRVRTLKFDRSNMSVSVGPMPRGPVTVAFPAVTARRFRLAFTRVTGQPALAEVDLSSAARVEAFVEKQLGKMHPTPLPLWDTYLWPAPAEPEAPELMIRPGAVQDLSARLAPDGVLRWEVPAGDWVIVRTGMTPTGMRNAPASPEGQGLEVDKMNRAAARAHFDAFIGQVLKRMPPGQRRAFKHVVADSYEMGSENWTDGFATTFRRRYGYDPVPWLPVLTGRVVGSADQADRFLWDLRRLVADRIATDYVGGLRDLCRPHGLRLWLENYGHWGFPAEFLQYGGQSDRVGGEFWVTGELGSIECRAAASCANTYGKPIVSAEAFTGGPAFQTAPWGLKARGDWAFCEGINHLVLHVYVHQPWEDRVPGVNAWFGTEFNRHNTWFDASRAWIDYLRRCCFLLQQGTRVADVAYFIGEDAPKMTGVRQPELPPGRDFDYLNAEIIETRLGVKRKRLTLPPRPGAPAADRDGATYRVLVLPELPTMRPELLRKVRDLVQAGATVVGRPPMRSPSRQHYPQCDQAVQELAREVWGARPLEAIGEHRLGQGRVVWGRSLDEVLGASGVVPDFRSGTPLRFTHRVAGNTHLYFVANPQPQAVATTAAFRVDGQAPEFWWPDSGRIEPAAVYEAADGAVRLPLNLGPHGSVFVVFRGKAAPDRIVGVARNGESVLSTALPSTPNVDTAAGNKPAANTFTLAVWVKPADSTTLFPETNRGVHGLSEPRNDVLFPPHGSAFGDASHAGCGLAVGRNGVVVFEHGANYFAPVLVHAISLTNWTHVAVVYRSGEPNLYLDGVFARKGRKSDFTVHSAARSGGGGTPFRGELGVIEQFSAALAEPELARLPRAMRRPDRGLPADAIELMRGAGGGVVAQFWEPGRYILQTAAGKERTIAVAAVPPALELTGPWEVRFGPGRGAAESVMFERLIDWAERPEERIKHYAGKATYRRSFELPATFEPGASPLFLDLGSVRDLAMVRVNGQALGTLWLAPWRVNVAAAARPGINELEIDVVNVWNNRLVGDARLPAAQRSTWLAAPTVSKDAPLLPAGLLGPVTLRAPALMTLW